MKKEFDLKIDGGTLDSIKIDSSNSLIIATYKRDVAEFKAGDIIVDDLGAASNRAISIFKCISKKNDNLFNIYASIDADCDSAVEFDQTEWDYITDQRLATEQEKQLLFDALKKQGKKWNAETLEVEKSDISEIVVDYESAIKYLGIKDTLLVFKSYDRVEKFNAQIKLQLIAEAWNKYDGFEADWADSSQKKFFTVFSLDKGKLQIDYDDYAYLLVDSQRANFSFKTEERARQFGNQFIDLFKVALGFEKMRREIDLD